ncbi:MAG: hypothetical protein ACR2M3_07710 [Thermomicrobiales bacterium]
MRFYSPAQWRARWCIALFVLAFVASIAFGGVATRADDPATATPDQSVGTLNGPPPTTPPTATTAPTSTIAPRATASATNTPTATTVTPTGTTAAPAASTTPAAAPGNAAPAPSNDDIQYEEHGNGRDDKNIVKVQNKTDNRLRVRGKIQLNHIPGADAQPENDAEAYSSCTDCSTFAVALQVDLISKTATTIAPKNVAIALNVQCSHCTTVAKAIQYVVQVDDPSQTPDNVKDLIGQMQQQLNAAAHDKDETVADAEAKIDAVIAQFNVLGQSLYTQRDQKDDDNSPGATVPPDAVVLTPTPTATP